MAEFVSKTISLDDADVEKIPPREAISALQQLNQQIEQSQPQHESVPDYRATASELHGSQTQKLTQD
jgi:hypothetical protein